MNCVEPSSALAKQTLLLARSLQRRFAARLVEAAKGVSESEEFELVSWLRDEGRHGGGTRLHCQDTAVFGRATVNVSGIHYDDLPEKRLLSASALSTIVHPAHPRAPSVHLHISFTELRDGSSFWRIMTDLNPSHPDEVAVETFANAVRQACLDQYESGVSEGDRYFYIPALDRHRGAFHFYLEGFSTNDWHADSSLAREVAIAVIDSYGDILETTLARHGSPTDIERRRQLDYHTLYFFQVLTLDRGTTSGLLVHDQNDVGILGSLPSHVDRDLLLSWRERAPDIQRTLLDSLVAALPNGTRVEVDLAAKRELARAVRAHYKAHPEALKWQGRGAILPPTVQNHE